VPCRRRSRPGDSNRAGYYPDGPVDLATLDAFLASDRAPPNRMQHSELDGFIAGIVVGPDMIPPSGWLPLVWRNGEPSMLISMKRRRSSAS
jgi:yecA family protein